MKRFLSLLLVAAFLGIGNAVAAVTYPVAVLADSPIAYWKLNEVTGTVALSATGHNGTYVGSPALGKPGLLQYVGDLAPKLDGTNDRVTASSMASGINWSKGFTLEAWVRFN